MACGTLQIQKIFLDNVMLYIYLKHFHLCCNFFCLYGKHLHLFCITLLLCSFFLNASIFILLKTVCGIKPEFVFDKVKNMFNNGIMEY